MTAYMGRQMNGPSRAPHPLRLQSLSERTESTLFQRRRQHAQEIRDHDQHVHGDGAGTGQEVPPFPTVTGMPDGLASQGLVSQQLLYTVRPF